MKQKPLLRAIIFFIYATVVAAPLFYFKYSVYPEILPKEALFESLVKILFFLWLALAITDKRYRPKWTPLMKALTVFVVVIVIASALGIDPARSFWSTYERALGTLALLHLAALALVISSLAREVKWRRVIYFSLAAAFVTDVIAWLQLWNPNLLLNEAVGNRPGATFGNPTFLAGYLLLNTFFAVYLFLASSTEVATKAEDEWRKDRNTRPRSRYYLPLLVSIVANVVTIFITQTRGDILGLGLGFFALLVLFVVKPPSIKIKFLNERTVYVCVLIFLFVVAGAFWLTRGSAFWSRVPGLDRFKDISLVRGSADVEPRLIAWSAAWRGFWEKPFLGWGLENFNVVYNKFYNPKALEWSYTETRFDEPHNFALGYLVSGGLPLFLAYFALWVFMIWEAKRSGDGILFGITLAALVAYFARNFFVFETLGPLLMFFLWLGIVDVKYKETRSALETATPSQSAPKSYWVYGAVVLAAVLIYFFNFLTVEAAYYEYWAFQNLVNRRVAEGIYDFKESSTIWSPYSWNIKRDYAIAVAEAYFYNPGLISNDEVVLAVRAMEEARDEHPLDAYNHNVLVDLYNEVSDVNPSLYLKEAEAEAQVALQLSPSRQEVYFSLAKTKSLEGDNPAALGILKYALGLDAKVPDAHFYYGLLSFATGDNATGYSEIEAAVQMGRPWKNYYEPRTVANFFAQSGHLTEARDLYLTALNMSQNGDLDSEVKLGVVYYFLGEYDSARKELSNAISKFDVRNSPSWNQLQPILGSLGVAVP